MTKRNVSQVEKVTAYAQSIVNTIEKWKRYAQNGCSDPAWSDGVNMNLLRNHIIYYKRQIISLCDQKNIPYPEELYLPLPPEIDPYFMANIADKKRLKMIGILDRISRKRPKYDDNQLEFLIFYRVFIDI